MGKIRCDLDRSERNLDMQNWVEKNKPLQSIKVVDQNLNVELLRQDLDEIAHDLTLNDL